jgi:DNA-binding response OmpR family regulator
MGANDYQAKPFGFEELVEHIHSVLRRQSHSKTEEGSTGQILQIGDLQLNTATHEAMRGEYPIELTPIDYNLLHLQTIRGVGYMLKGLGEQS